MRILPLFLLGPAIAAFLAPVPAKAQSAETILAFADQLSIQGDYYRAITEYKRFLFMHPEHEESSASEYKIALCYFMGGRLETAETMFQTLKEKHVGAQMGRQAALMLAQTYYNRGEFRLAADELREYEAAHHSGDCPDAARMMAAVCLLRLENLGSAAAELARISPDSALNGKARSLSGEFADCATIRRKNPWLAGAFSALLPGAGQLYVERPRDAILSFLLNGALIFAAYEAFDRDEVVAGSLVAFVETGWYLGNIYNAASGAHKFNRTRKEEFFEDLELQYGLNLFSGDGFSLCPSLGMNLRF